jgi:hypothetical protein
MHDNYSHRRFTLLLPVAVAKHLNSRFNVEQAILGSRQDVAPRQEVPSDRLRVTIDEGAARTEWLAEKITAMRRGQVRRLGGNP